MAKPEPQLTRWGPVDGLPPGISIDAINGPFVSWEQLQDEIKVRLLPQVDAASDWTEVRLGEHRGKTAWIIQVLNQNGQEMANVWYGPDPLYNWAYDGLVRIGPPHAPPRVWQVFQRYSDGSYRRLDIDEFRTRRQFTSDGTDSKKSNTPA